MKTLQEKLQLAERRERRYSLLEEGAASIEDRLKYRKLKNKYSDQADRLHHLINFR